MSTRHITRCLSSAALIALLAALSAPASADGGNRVVFQSADVVEFFGPDPDPNALVLRGGAWLKRSRNHVDGRVMAQVEKAGYAYTVWWVIFNNPGACVDGCNGEDLGNPDVRGAVYYGNGAISSSDGMGGGVINIDVSTTAARIPVGTFRLDDVLPEPVFFRRGLARGNGMRAEIHLVVDEHSGPAKDGTQSWVPDLTTTDFPGIPVLGASNHRAVVFPPIAGGSHDDDSDD